ncbi:hypothetical protein C366_03866 [Cryptococcus neoformans Tu401-1]|nr:hypothetical protein C366_03866 [Cryptococcus neoformans var. grubii Tu401-1]
MVSSSRSPSPKVPQCPNGLFHFPSDSVLVTDADEDVMEIYMYLATMSDNTDKQDIGKSSEGLGYLDLTQSVLELQLDLTIASTKSVEEVDSYHQRKDARSRGKRGKKKGIEKNKEVQSVEVRLQQDLTALKGRKGDTGSVLWRSSLYLARHVLSQYYHPSAEITPLLDPSLLKSSRILELGCGTGLLAVLLSRICGQYTASDRLENLKLVQRNIELNGLTIGNGKVNTLGSLQNSVELEEIDWVQVSEDGKKRNSRPEPERNHEEYDLVLAVDCIYNEALVPPLVDTFARYCPIGGRTMVWVVVELRSADVMTTFLDSWLQDSSGPWTIVRLGEDAMGDWDGKRPRWAGWVGWR